MKRKILLFAIMLCLLVGSMIAAHAEALPGTTDLTGTLVILHTNDSHGRAGDGMGFASVAALKQTYTSLGATVFVLDAGDTLHGMPIATADRGASIVELMNAVGYDAMVPGNHDFNYGSDRLLELAGEMNFPLLADNVIVNETGETLLSSSILLEKGGAKVGIIGVTTPDTALQTNPSHTKGLTFEEPADATQAQVDALKEQGAQYIIVLSHLGTNMASAYTSLQLAQDVSGIDIIIDGHSHTLLENGQKEGNTLICSTGEYMEHVGIVIVSPQGEIAASLIGEAYTCRDEGITRRIAEITAAQDELLNVKVGETSVLLDGERENVRTRETNMGDWVCDMLLEATDADVAIMNGGGIRASIAAGDITRKDLLTVFPFGNTVVTLKVTGSELRAALETGLSAYPEQAGSFPQIGGMRLTFQAGAQAGSRITSLEIDGKPIEDEKEYLLATNDFIANGGDYDAFTDNTVVTQYGTLEELLTTALGNAGSISPETDGRITVEDNANVLTYTLSLDGKTVYTLVGAIVSDENGSRFVGKLYFPEQDEAALDIDIPLTEAFIALLNPIDEVPATDGDSPSGSTTPEAGGAGDGGSSDDPTAGAGFIPDTTDEPSGSDTLDGVWYYTVLSTDTLGGIARRFYNGTVSWQTIYEMNTEVITNPNLLSAGMILKMPPVESGSNG